jgi:hypothetical protein
MRRTAVVLLLLVALIWVLPAAGRGEKQAAASHPGRGGDGCARESDGGSGDCRRDEEGALDPGKGQAGEAVLRSRDCRTLDSPSVDATAIG